jgi:hypothetical protein
MVDAVENIKPICEVEKVGVAGKIFFRLFQKENIESTFTEK